MKEKKTTDKKKDKQADKKIPDRHLDIPSEANRDKHINFTALENNDTDPADQPSTGKLSGEEQTENKRSKD
jgi:hypothetical protein